MTLSIAELRAKVNSQKQTNNYDSSSIFSFSKLNPGDQVKIRFIDDGEENDFFWRPRCTRTLRFNSILLANGEVVDNKTYVSVPAFNIKKGDVNISNLPENYLYYSNEDVINTKIKPFWDGTPEGQAIYNKFGRTERFIFQGFIRSEGYENKLYRFVINKDLFNVIYSFITDDEIEHTPSDPIHGRDFILKVTKKIANINGKPQEVKDYKTSKWSSIETPLNENEKKWLEENSPYVLKNFIPSKPSVEQEKIMVEMFEASYRDEPYDVAKWGKIFKPDNVFFDELGNIKDLKNNSTMTDSQNIAPKYETSVENNTSTQPVVQESSSVNQSISIDSLTKDQIMALLNQSNTVAQEAKPVEIPTQNVTQLINQHSESVAGDNPQDVIANIMNKFNIQQ